MADLPTTSDQPENLVLRYLRRIDERLTIVVTKLDEVVIRLGRLERASNVLALHALGIEGW